MIRMIKILDMRVPTWQKSRWVGEADCEIHALTGKQQIVTWEPTFVWRERCFVCCQYSRLPAIIQYTAPPAHLPWQAYITKNVLCDITADCTFKLMQVWFDLAQVYIMIMLALQRCTERKSGVANTHLVDKYTHLVDTWEWRRHRVTVVESLQDLASSPVK